MGKVAVISVAVLCVAAVHAVTYDFATPANCDPHITMDEKFLLNSITVKTRGLCARECAHNARCTSLTTVGNHPNVQCKLFEQFVNRYSSHISPSPPSTYLEKQPYHVEPDTDTVSIIKQRTNACCLQKFIQSVGSYRPKACTKDSRDVGGECDKRDAKLYVGEYLLRNEYLCSPDGRYRALMQDDGNFVLYDSSNGNALWQARTGGTNAHRARLLETGQLVIEDVDGNQLYSTDNSGEPKYMLLTNDGTLLVQSKSSEDIWIAP